MASAAMIVKLKTVQEFAHDVAGLTAAQVEVAALS
jgi:hypothetical protein